MPHLKDRVEFYRHNDTIQHNKDMRRKKHRGKGDDSWDAPRPLLICSPRGHAVQSCLNLGPETDYLGLLQGRGGGQVQGLVCELQQRCEQGHLLEPQQRCELRQSQRCWWPDVQKQEEGQGWSSGGGGRRELNVEPGV